MRLGRPADAVVGWLESDTAVDVVDDDRGDKAQNHDSKEESEDEAQEWQGEDVERDVHAERRVARAE